MDETFQEELLHLLVYLLFYLFIYFVFQMTPTSVTSCSLRCTQGPSKSLFILGGKNFLLTGKLFPFREEPFWQESKNISERVIFPCACIHLPFPFEIHRNAADQSKWHFLFLQKSTWSVLSLCFRPRRFHNKCEFVSMWFRTLLIPSRRQHYSYYQL